MLRHVVVVTDNVSVDGGSAKVALGSSRALALSGLSVTIFCATGEPSQDLTGCPNLRIVNTKQGDALSSPGRIGGAVRGLWNVRAAKEMGSVLETLDPAETVVHVHGWTKALSSSVLGKVVAAGFPMVVTLHEYFSACPNGSFYIHPERKICTLRPMSLNCLTTDCDSRNYIFKMYRVARQAIQQIAGAIPGGVSQYITVSEFSRRILEPLLPSGSCFYHVDNPIDARKSDRVEAERNNAFVFVGRLSAEKGGLLFAEAGKAADVPVVFVGDGAERLAIERANPEARVIGWQDKAGVEAALRKARALVVPSLWYETLGLSVIEAAALGVPAIVSRGTAPHDLIVPNATGLGFERGDSADLARRLRDAADDNLVASLSRGAYDTYWKRPFTFDSHVARLREVYASVLGHFGHADGARSSELCA